MRPINLIADFDGTLVDRDRKLDECMVNLVLNSLRQGWRFNLLTGRSIGDVRQRFVGPLLSALPYDDRGLLSNVRIFTCEGASAWRFCMDGSTVADTSYSVASRAVFSERDRRKVEDLLDRNLVETLRDAGLALAMRPEWWENAILVFKATGDLSRRNEVVESLSALIHQDMSVPVGVAGKTSIVIARANIDKRAVFTETLSGCWREYCNVYIAVVASI